MNPESTPEEKLLRLIRRKEKPKSEPKAGVEKNPIPLRPFKKKFRVEFRQYLNFKAANKILIYLLIATLAYAGYITLPKKKYPAVIVEKGQVFEPFAEETAEVAPEPDSSGYLKEIEQRNLFRAALKSESPYTQGQFGVNEMAKDLVLMGVVSGEMPQAIIEDRKTNKVYFLNEGDYLGSLQVQ